MILVTGGTGLVGSHLLQELTSKGKKVRALRRKSSELAFVKHVFHAYAENPEQQLKLIEWVEGDVLDIFSLEEAMKGVTHIYHNAAVISFNASDREIMKRVNVDGTANVVNVALENKVKKLCHASSIAALGRAKQDGITDENTSWVSSRHNSYYAISKYSGEREVWRGTAEGLDAVVVIPSIIIGLSNINKGSMQLFKSIHNGLPLYTSGTNGYISAKDLVKAQIFLMESDIVNEKFVISAENLSYKEVAGMIADGFGKKRPSIKVNYFLAILARNFFKVKSLFTGKPPLITRESARTAMRTYEYSSKKFTGISGMAFQSISNTISDICHLYNNNGFFESKQKYEKNSLDLLAQKREC
jgi:nucleoside-diphosphate-sugar epimerase